MIYLLWTIFNIALFLFFIIICFRATKLIREKLGLFASTVFVFGLLSFVSSSNDKDDIYEKGNHQAKTWVFKSENDIESNTTSYYQITIEKNLVSTIDLGVLYGKERSSGNIVAIEANSSLLGLMGGHKWKPEMISVNKFSSRDSLNYTVVGSLKWMLLGATIYSQNKILTGFIPIK